MSAFAEIAAEVHDEWVREGRLHTWPDSTVADDELAFWAEVDRRMQEARDA